MMVVFGFQSLFGYFYLSGGAAIYVIGIFSIGLIAYFSAYYFLGTIKVVGISRPTFYWELNEKILALILYVVTTLYFLLFFYIVFSAQKVALLEAFFGNATGSQITEAREMLLNGREGFDRIIPYAFVIFTSVLMPYFLMLSFLGKNKFSWLIFIGFISSLVFSMEKMLILKAIFPIFVLSINGYQKRRIIFLAPLFVACILFSMSFMARGVDGRPAVEDSSKSSIMARGVDSMDTVEDSSKSSAVLASPVLSTGVAVFQRGHELSLSEHIRKYYPLRGDSTLGQLINRALWIPYITAYDWIEFFQEKGGAEYLYGATSSLVSKLRGVPQYPMEENIFKYQFGENATKTARANVNFMIDAFVNFGWLGVILVSGFVGASTLFLQKLSNPAAFACFYFFLFQLLGGGFLGTFLGGGLFLFLLLIYFVRPPNGFHKRGDISI